MAASAPGGHEIQGRISDARAPEKTQGSLGSKSTPGPKQPAAMATTTTTTTHLTAGLEDANLASKILSHQVAADAVHSRELAALQLKYATKTTELDAAHATREAHRPQQEEVLFTNDDSEIAGDLNSLKAQYNKLTRATAASRAAHRTRVAEVRDAQTKEANGLKREQKALQKSLADVDATYDASVKTLETQLLLLLRSKLEAASKQELDAKKRLIDEARSKRDSLKGDQSNLAIDLEGLERRLEDQRTRHAAEVAAAARDALAEAQAELARQLKAKNEAGDRAKKTLQDEIEALLKALADAKKRHDRALKDAKKQHDADLRRRRETHAHELRVASDGREAAADGEVDALEADARIKREQQARDLASLRDAMARLEKIIKDATNAAKKLDKEAPRNRAALEKRRDKDLERLQNERKKALEKRRKRRAREMEEAVLDATERARREGREACDRLVAEDDSARRLDDEAERLRRLLAEANKRAEAALQNKKNRLAALEKDHRRAMASVVVDHGEEPVQASVRDDLTDARAMAQARRAELVLSDKRAAADELRTDCASYADALAALQRALGAERAAHGASVRRQQAELDAKESELALLRAETGGDLRHADEGAKLLDAHDMKGDETVMAEWRTLVQAEKEKSNHATVRGPAGDYVHSKRWDA